MINQLNEEKKKQGERKMKPTKVFLKKPGGNSKVKYFANIKFDDVATLNGFTILDSKEGGLLVLPPSERYQDKNTGETKWSKRLWIDPESKDGAELLAKIEEAVTIEIRKEEHAKKKSTEREKEDPDYTDVDDIFGS